MPENEGAICGRVMVGSGTDTYDPICELSEGHGGSCKSSAAIDQHRLAPAKKCYVAWFTAYPSTHQKAGQTVEVVTREWAEAEVERLRAELESYRRATRREHNADRASDRY